MRRPVPIIVGSAIMLGVLLTGCTPVDPARHDMHGPEAHSDTNRTIPDATSVESEGAEEAATAALSAFGNTSRSQADWWAELEPLMHPSTAPDYAIIDPQVIPPFTITGPGTLDPSSVPQAAEVIIPTNIGDYRVTVVRADAASPWLVGDFTPPAEDPA